MAPKHTTKKARQGPFTELFLTDPWRKLLAIALGFFAWYFVSNAIAQSKPMELTVVTAAEAELRPGLTLGIPPLDNYVLWWGHNRSVQSRPKVTVTLNGPEKRIQEVPTNLKLSVSREKMAAIKKELDLNPKRKKVEIKNSDLTVPDFPSLENLIVGLKSATGSTLILSFDKRLQNIPHTLAKDDFIEFRLPENKWVPEGYKLQRDKIYFKPIQVMLSGPQNLIDNIRTFRPGMQDRQHYLLESFPLDDSIPITEIGPGRAEVILSLNVGKVWQQLTMTPETVEIHLPLKPTPVEFLSEEGIEVQIVGEDADKWEIVRKNPKLPETRGIDVQVFNKDYYWQTINNVPRPGENPKPNLQAREAWVRKYVRLLVTTADLDPNSEEAEQSPLIHAQVIPPDGDDLPDVKITILEGPRLTVRKRK